MSVGECALMRWMMIGVVLGLALPATAQPQAELKQREGRL